MEKVSPQIRILALVLVLVGVGGMLALRMLGPSDEPVTVSAAALTPRKAAAPQPAKAAGSKPAQAQAPVSKAQAAKPATPAKPKPAKPAKPAVPPSGFPLVVDKALARNEVVVLSLVVPGARVDELAAAEAEAGAKLGGAGFLALNVLNEDVARALLTKLDAVTDPSVVVVTRSGKIALELGGFVDRETVAQAAANASS
jgi:hypothetical protein